jgi:hypothetical protein
METMNKTTTTIFCVLRGSLIDRFRRFYEHKKSRIISRKIVVAYLFLASVMHAAEEEKKIIEYATTYKKYLNLDNKQDEIMDNTPKDEFKN